MANVVATLANKIQRPIHGSYQDISWMSDEERANDW
jgi:hypothetical protein